MFVAESRREFGESLNGRSTRQSQFGSRGNRDIREGRSTFQAPSSQKDHGRDGEGDTSTMGGPTCGVGDDGR